MDDPPGDPIDTKSDEAVSLANARFYQALERADLPAMIDAWAHGDDVSYAHPGRKPLLGWTEVLQSWRSIFEHGGNPQLILTDEIVVRRDAVAWVTLTENMLSGGQTGAATALNMFELDADGWKMVAHHAGPVVG